MISRRSFALLVATTVCAFAPANSPSTSASESASLGTANGTWELPFGAQDGYIDGFFYRPAPSTTSAPAFHISGNLVASPVACPACIAGTIQAVLDDGVGSAPDYFVYGHYNGAWSSGAGTFQARIYSPTSAAPVGWFKGKFNDPPQLPVLGHFDGRWVIND